MSEWIEVPVELFSRVTTSENHGLQSFRSPFDVPTAIRTRFEAQDQTLEVDFAYLGSEEAEVVQVARGIRFSVGKNSHRVFKLILDVKHESGSEELEQAVLDSLKVLVASIKKAPSDHYEAVGDAVRLRRLQLFNQ